MARGTKMCWTLRSKLSVLRLSPLPFWLEHILAQGTKPIIHSLDTSQMGSSLVHSGVPHGGFLNLSFRCKGGAHAQQRKFLRSVKPLSSPAGDKFWFNGKNYTRLRHKSNGVQFSPFGCRSRGVFEFVHQVERRCSHSAECN